MACPGVEVVLNALLERRGVSPSDHGVQERVTATIRQIRLAEAQA